MKKNEKSRRVVARILAEELTDEDLKSISGGCVGPTCTAAAAIRGGGAPDTDRGLDSSFEQR